MAMMGYVIQLLNAHVIQITFFHVAGVNYMMIVGLVIKRIVVHAMTIAATVD
jgi:hypothetical protein